MYIPVTMVHVPEQADLPPTNDIAGFMRRNGVYNAHDYDNQQRYEPVSFCGEWADMGNRWELPVAETNLPEVAQQYPTRQRLAPFTNILRIYKDGGAATLWLAT